MGSFLLKVETLILVKGGPGSRLQSSADHLPFAVDHDSLLSVVTGRHYRGALRHQHHGGHLGAGAVQNATRYGVALVGAQFDRLVFEIEKQEPRQDEEHLVLLLVPVPVELALHDSQTDHAVVHVAERLIEPLILAGIDKGGDVDLLPESEHLVHVEVVLGFSHVGENTIPPCVAGPGNRVQGEFVSIECLRAQRRGFP